MIRTKAGIVFLFAIYSSLFVWSVSKAANTGSEVNVEAVQIRSENQDVESGTDGKNALQNTGKTIEKEKRSQKDLARRNPSSRDRR